MTALYATFGSGRTRGAGLDAQLLASAAELGHCYFAAVSRLFRMQFDLLTGVWYWSRLLTVLENLFY